jgi:uncharacterized protein (DUF2147 family)
MTKFAALTAMTAALAGPAVAADITGIWIAPSRGAHVEIAPCGDEGYCGTVVSATPAKTNPKLLDVHNKDPAQRNRSMIGARLMEGFKGGPDRWSGGTVYNPGDGHTYGGSLTLLDPDHLLLRGCVLFGLVCKSQTWTRLKE